MLRKITIAFTCAMLLLTFNRSIAQKTDCKYLVWSDDFELPGTPSNEKWNYDLGGGGWGNNELQTYTNSSNNSWVEGGKLIIKAVKNNGSWTSARLVSKQKGDWLYGRIEVKAKLPVGKGTWPAIWMLPTDWEYGNWPASGEIDIMEHVGYDPGVIHGTAHTQAYNHSIGTQKGANIKIADAQSAFHVYAVEWDTEKINWYVDDQLYFTFNNEHKTYKEWPFDKRFHLLLNIAIGGNWGGAQGIDPSLTNASMEIDYVRVYQNQLPTPVIKGETSVKKGDELVFSAAKIDGITYEWEFPAGTTVISGQKTNEVRVKWGNENGLIKLLVKSDCHSVSATPLSVSVIDAPTGNKFFIPFFNTEGLVVWSTLAGNNNQISLSKNEGLQVTYSINEPANNPYIVYEFAGLMDFSQYSEMALMIKTDPVNLPSVIRIDMEDKNGNVNQNDLFKISTFGSSSQFQQYSYQFGKNPDGKYLLNEIRRIKIYINYGLFGKKGNGSIEIKDLYLALPGTTNVSINELPAIRVFPNPFTSEINIEGAVFPVVLELINPMGQIVWREKMNNTSSFQVKTELPNGIYFLQITNQTGKTQLIKLVKQ